VAIRIERTKAEARATGSGVAGVTSTLAAIQPLFADLGEQLVEQHRLADTAQPVQDPATVSLAELVNLAAHHGERIQDGLPPGEHRWPAPGARSERVGHRIHVADIINAYMQFA
jgi:hypothetical protein